MTSPTVEKSVSSDGKADPATNPKDRQIGLFVGSAVALLVIVIGFGIMALIRLVT